MAHKSGDAALLLKGTELITLINKEDFTAAGFKDILQKSNVQKLYFGFKYDFFTND